MDTKPDLVHAANELAAHEPKRQRRAALPVSLARSRLSRFSACLIGVVGFFGAEAVVVGVLQQAQLTGPWELRAALTHLVPIALGAALPLVVLAALTAPLLSRRPTGLTRGLLAALSGASGLAVGYGVSFGPSFTTPLLRAAFVVGIGCAGALAAWLLLPSLQKLKTERPGSFLLLCVVVAVAASAANATILPMLYTAFHLALTAVAIFASAWAAEAMAPHLSPRAWGSSAALVLLGSGLAMPFLLRDIKSWDNMRLVYLAHAPSLGRAVQVAAWLAPKHDDSDFAATLVPTAAAQERRWLDWTGRDVLVVSVDALRADHVGAYGYRRPTTPNIDALAAQGVLFDYAYSVMPHTSYSMTSLLTGKYMRPLLLQGAGHDSDTLAAVLRRYGYRTAAFFPHSLVAVDRERFGWVAERGLDFEYRKVEYAQAPKRVEQFRYYLQQLPADVPVFAWVHLFEPHEPYDAHPEHPFGNRALDRYDAEIAAADAAVGQVVQSMRERSPDAVVIVTADHGEAFGEHGAHYHGTTVFDEQTRVPLVIATPGLSPGRVSAPVQLIDLFPTLLHAMDIPRRPRVRGNNLGAWLAGKGAGEGFAFSETHEQTLLAQGPWRLVCERNVDACALYDLRSDSQQERDVTAQQTELYAHMRAKLRELEASQGAYERAGARLEGKSLPAALVRGMAGDADAARDVAALLDDADVVLRRRAAQVLYDLQSKDAAAALSLAVSRDEDEVVRRWCALALTRIGHGAPLTREILALDDRSWKRRAALALAEAGDASGEPVLLAWWNEGGLAADQAELIARALGRIRSTAAVVPLTRSLRDARLRPVLANVLAEINDPYGRIKLLEHLPKERYVHTRVSLIQALIRMGATRELAPSLVRFLGVPDPLQQGVEMAARAGILDAVGGPNTKGLARLRASTTDGLQLPVVIPKGGNGSGVRVLVRARLRAGVATDPSAAQVRIGLPKRGVVPSAGVASGPAGRLDPSTTVVLQVEAGPWSEPFATLPAAPAPGRPARLLILPGRDVILDALAVVPLAEEIPSPPPVPWLAGEAPDGGARSEPEMTDASPAD